MASVVNVTIHSEISEFPTEKRYDRSIKISDLKKKLELITGANHKSMKITMSLGEKDKIELSNDDETLAFYLGTELSKDSDVKIYVKDEQPSLLLEGDVPKYTISEEKYKERSNNVREFIKQTREKLGNGQ